MRKPRAILMLLIGAVVALGVSSVFATGQTGPTATIHVAELIPQVVDWNREFLAAVNGVAKHARHSFVPAQKVHLKSVRLFLRFRFGK